MANIMDYLDWRGDVPLSLSPFNEVDNLIFAKFSFIDLCGILPERVADGGMVLSEAVARYFEMHPNDEKLGLIVPPQTRPLIRKLAECPRFRDMKLYGFVNHIDESLQKQFCALTVGLDENEAYVVFRGTDDTLVGWKENFNMSFLEAIPAQLDAVAYLNEAGKALPQARLYVGGHSKGGNLAIYSSIRCDEDIKARIVRVYSNDGPGYRREVVDSPEYREMESRIVNIVPQSSVVGRLLENNVRCCIVQSTASGLWQHDGFSWEVKGTSFVGAPRLTVGSQTIDRSLKKWIADMNDEQKERVVDAFYRVLTATNAKTLTELADDRNWLWHLMSRSDPESRKLLLSALTQLTGEAGRQWLESVMREQKKASMKKKRAAEQKKKEAAQKKLIAQRKKKLRATLKVREQGKAGAVDVLKNEAVQTGRAFTHLVGQLIGSDEKKTNKK